MKFHLPILAYHRIGQPEKGSKLSGLYVSLHEFMWQMAYLNNAGYRSLHVDEFLSILYGEIPSPERVVLIAFDDGSKSVLHSAYPILKKYGMTALLSLVTNCIGGESNWTAEKEKRCDSILSWDEIAYLKDMGLDFASHTLNHPDLSSMGDDRIRQELQMSRKILEDKINRPITSFTYPFSAYNKRVMELVREAGYRCAFSTYRGNRHGMSECYQLRRVSIPPYINLQGFKYLISPVYDWENRMTRAGVCLVRQGFRIAKGAQVILS